MFRELHKKIIEEAVLERQVQDLFEMMSVAQAKQNLSVPDIRPGLFDGSVNAWLIRLSTWGKVKFEYYNPETRRKRKIQKAEFKRLLTSDTPRKVFGKWDTKRKDLTKLEISRQYLGVNGKKQTEKLFIDIKLKPELRKNM